MKSFRHPLVLLALANASFWSLPWLLDHSQLLLARWREVPQWVGGRPDQDVVMGLMQLGALPEPLLDRGPESHSVLPDVALSADDRSGRVAQIDALTSVALEPVASVLPAQPVLRSSQPARPASLDLTPAAAIPPALLMQRLRRADGLGGEITLASLKEPVMPVAARAERLQHQRSGDPLAALPLHWRSAMREQLNPSQPVSRVAMVRVPAPGLRERQEIPIVIDDQGGGEAFVEPRNPKIQDVVEQWAAKQSPAEPGTVQILVVAAEPLGSGVE